MMIQRLIHRLLLRRHFWRYATFSEIAELYASRLLRMFALNFVSVFISVYLLRIGYDLVFIGGFWALFYGVKAILAVPSAHIISYFGPKHATLFSNVLSALALFLLPYVEQHGVTILIVWCMLQAFSSVLNNQSYLVDFSKVKHLKHAGKEIGYMQIIEKVAAGAAPLFGGVVAAFYGPTTAMVISALLFLLSALPLLLTAEPIRVKQHIRFQGFPWADTWRGMRADFAIGADVFASGNAWTLFISLVVFAGDGRELYAKIGALGTLTIVMALVASYVFGKIIDRHRGGQLLTVLVSVKSLVHVFRPFVTSVPGLVATSMTNDAATTGYNMAFLRGMFDTADFSGHRIAYISLMEVAVNLGAAIASLLFAACFMLLPTGNGFTTFFCALAALTLLIATPRFALYKKLR